MAGPTLDAIGVVASDVTAAVTFYRRIGVPFPPDIEIDQHVECEIVPGLRLMIDSVETIRSFEADYEATSGNRVAFAVRLDSPAEVDALYAELAADGHGRTEPWDAPWGMRYSSVADPDGQQVDLYADLPGEA